MKIEFQTRWLRLLIELWAAWMEIRRYGVIPRPLENETIRPLRRRIAGCLRHLHEDQSV
jgi:hypothetical protein